MRTLVHPRTHSLTFTPRSWTRRERKRGNWGCVGEKIQFTPLIDLCLVIFLISGSRKYRSPIFFLHNRKYFLAMTSPYTLVPILYERPHLAEWRKLLDVTLFWFPSMSASSMALRCESLTNVTLTWEKSWMEPTQKWMSAQCRSGTSSSGPRQKQCFRNFTFLMTTTCSFSSID